MQSRSLLRIAIASTLLVACSSQADGAAEDEPQLVAANDAGASPTLPHGSAKLVGNGMRGDPFDASKPWTPQAACALDLTISAPTPNESRYAVTYLVPYSYPLVSGRMGVSGGNGTFVGVDHANPGVVVQRAWNRTLTLQVQADGTIAWSLTDREQQTSTVGGPAGGVGSGSTALWKCSGVTDAAAFH